MAKKAMTWKQLEEWAERNGWPVYQEDGGGIGYCSWAYLELVGHPSVALEAAAMTPGAAKRALCRAVTRIREAV